jgi:uncharacterized protein YchJ
MYDNFELTKCTIVEESYEGEDKAAVKFIAEMVKRDSREKTGFMETSTFERAKTHGGWLYRDGIIEAPPNNDYDNNEGEADDTTVAVHETKDADEGGEKY